jgi:hypothetical protein
MLNQRVTWRANVAGLPSMAKSSGQRAGCLWENANAGGDQGVGALGNNAFFSLHRLITASKKSW